MSSPCHKMLRLPRHCKMHRHKVLRLPREKDANIHTLYKVYCACHAKHKFATSTHVPNATKARYFGRKSTSSAPPMVRKKATSIVVLAEGCEPLRTPFSTLSGHDSNLQTSTVFVENPSRERIREKWSLAFWRYCCSCSNIVLRKFTTSVLSNCIDYSEDR